LLSPENGDFESQPSPEASGTTWTVFAGKTQMPNWTVSKGSVGVVNRGSDWNIRGFALVGQFCIDTSGDSAGSLEQVINAQFSPFLVAHRNEMSLRRKRHRNCVRTQPDHPGLLA
jgi:hypothetical protein